MNAQTRMGFIHVFEVNNAADQGCPSGMVVYRVRNRRPETTTMIGPAKNRLHDYEAGWLTLLLQMGVAEERALREAQNRVAQAAIDDMNERREWRRAKRTRRNRKGDGE
jgi:hypothetical protein